MKKILFTLVVFSCFPIFGQTILEIENETVSLEEFKRVYLKNNSGEMVNKSSVEEYMELYINFKLKVNEAKRKGLDTISSFKQEIERISISIGPTLFV